MRSGDEQRKGWAVVVVAAIWLLAIVPLSAAAAPYAAFVMDARTGEVLHARNADTRLHPASLTKMMTLYIVFEAVENGEIGLDDLVTISRKAASEPPSRLGLKAGQKIRLRYLIRAAAVKSANDAATALAEAIEGSEARFVRRMNRTAKALGMTRTTFKNAHGLTADGHLSTARDMTVLGRHLFYDYPQYYNLFSRLTADAGIRKVRHTNHKLLRSYRGADGIKTGYTRASGFNLTASAARDGKRIIATIFGGRSSASRNAKMAELLDLGFRRASRRAALHKPAPPPYLGPIGGGNERGRYGRMIRLASAAAVERSLRPRTRPAPRAPEPALPATDQDGIKRAILTANAAAASEAEAEAEKAETVAQAETADIDARVPAQPSPPPAPDVTPVARPDYLLAANSETGDPAGDPVQTVVERISTSGGRHWGITVGRYPSEYMARKVLLQVALNEMTTLDGSLRKVLKRRDGFDANFMGLTREMAELACRRLQARKITCFMINPDS